MAAGLYHPNCRDSHTTYFEGISTPPDDKFTREEIEEIKEEHSLEQKKSIARRNYERHTRLAENSLDENNKKAYESKAEYWRKEYGLYHNHRTGAKREKSMYSKGDVEQYERYRNVLGNNVPEKLEDFLEIKYNDKTEYGKLKHSYRIVNQYESNSGNMDVTKIVELHDEAVADKALFTGKARKKGNIGIMELDGKRFIASSSVNESSVPGYVNYKGDRNKIVLKPKKAKFKTTKEGTHERDVDSEYKLLEYAASIAEDGKPHKIHLLSEKAMCPSCRGVMKQFKEKYPDVEVEVVSHRSDRSKKNFGNNSVFDFDVKREYENANN